MATPSLTVALRAYQQSKQADLGPHCSLPELEAYYRKQLPEINLDTISDHLAYCSDCCLLLLYAVAAPDQEGEVFVSPKMQLELAKAQQRVTAALAREEPDFDSEIDQVYDEISALSRDPSSPDRDAKISDAFSRIKDLEHREADQFQKRFERRLNMPIDAGAKILERAEDLRSHLENLVANYRAAEETPSP